MPFNTYRGQHEAADTDIRRCLQGKRRSAPSPRHAHSESPNRPLIASVAALSVAAAIAGYFVLFPHTVTVKINGTREDVTVGSTIEKLIHDGYANPTPGDMLAVDGTIAIDGGGDAFEAKIDGKKAEAGAAITADTKCVEISDGSDTDEPVSERTEKIKPPQSAEPTLSDYYNAPIHLYRKAADGIKTVRTGKVSGRTVEEVTKEPVAGGFDAVHADTGGEKVVALTFDDGPWAGTTSQILDILKENGAHATFFQIGRQVPGMADVEKRIVEEGNQVATHTYDHAAGSGQGVNLSYMTVKEQRDEVEKGIEAIESTIGRKISHVMRAPGGNYYGKLPTTLSDISDVEIGWSIDTEDWRRPGSSAIEQRILKAKPGSVILMHDGGGNRSQTVEALRRALPKLKAQGYRFVTVDELLEYCK